MSGCFILYTLASGGRAKMQKMGQICVLHELFLNLLKLVTCKKAPQTIANHRIHSIPELSIDEAIFRDKHIKT
jgi:hypothetical protein